MTGVLGKLFPVVASTPCEDLDDGKNDNIEYSFALEYSGPMVSYDIPQVVPIEVGHLPVTSVGSSISIPGYLSLPVIEPIAKIDPLIKKFSGDLILGQLESSCQLDCLDTGEVSTSKEIDYSGSLTYEGTIVESSGTLCGTQSCDNSNDSSECAETSKLPDDNILKVDFQPYASSHVPSSRISSCSVDELNNDRHVRTPVVRFCDPESSDAGHESYGDNEAKNDSQRPEPEHPTKKGSCYRCLKGNSFTKKETCIVCGAKYCITCVVRAMGTMPEGRKCLACVGYSVNESNRRALGKSSRLLKQLFPKSEIKHIMKREAMCEVNCLPSKHLVVNGRPLCREEVFMLQNSSNPPKRLKPGNYWYDKVSGLWGKEGKNPCQFITPQLNVGDQILRNASNGNTTILMNNREITKAEVWMLKSAGVQCHGNTSFWVSADGFCQEEGQNIVKGPIWDKPATKLVCAALFLPIPYKLDSSSGEDNSLINGVLPTHLQHGTLHKLLLVGHNRSGTSTLYKQAKILYNVPFTVEEQQNIKLVIQINLYRYLGILLEGRERFEKESLIEIRESQVIDRTSLSGNDEQVDGKTVYTIGPRLLAFSDWLLEANALGNLDYIIAACTRENATFVDELWKDGAIQATYDRRNELPLLPRVASYFLDRAVEISQTDYEPSDMDILYAEGITSSNSLACMEFSFPESTVDDTIDCLYQHDSSSRYQLIRVHPKSLGENCKWLEMFADFEAILFCVALNDIDQFIDDENGVRTNKMLASKKLFETIATYPTFCDKKFVLILNKFDLLEEIIPTISLAQCEWFEDYNPVMSYRQHNTNSNNNHGVNSTPAQRASHYIASKFKRLFYALTGQKLYVSLVMGFVPDTVDELMKYVREILKWDEEKHNFSSNEWSSCSIDITSFT